MALPHAHSSQGFAGSGRGRLLAVNHCPPGFGPLTGPRPGRSPRSSIFEATNNSTFNGLVARDSPKDVGDELGYAVDPDPVVLADFQL